MVVNSITHTVDGRARRVKRDSRFSHDRAPNRFGVNVQ